MYVIVTANEELVKMARQNEIKSFELPDDFDLSRLERISKTPTKEAAITKFLISLGIQTHLKGFTCLKLLITHCLENPGFESKAITKVIYPTCAKALNTTPSRVERAIRHAIERGFVSPNSNDKYIEIFGDIDKTPTNDQFISTVMLYIRENLF